MNRDQLFRALIATSVDGIMVIDTMANVQVYSEACVRLFGYSADEVIGQNVKMLMPEPYHAQHDDYVRHYQATGERHIIGIGREVTGRRKDGTTFPMYLSVGEGEFDGKRIFVGIVHDITAERQRDQRIGELQSELIHSTRVTAMGQMSSAIAHELNQPLSSIIAYVSGMQRLIENETASPDVMREALAQVSKEATRAGQIIRRLRSFVEKRESNRNPEHVAPIVAEALSLGTIGLAANGIRVSCAVEPDLPPVSIDKIQIQQVLVNLIRNAVEAMDGSPRLELTVTAENTGDGHVRITVSDTGKGLDENIIPNLFTPFATTKEQGMGMGLNICRTIIEAHQGRIWAEPNSDGGAQFRFQLPALPNGSQQLPKGL